MALSASQVYQPQINSEQQALDSAYAQTNQSLDTESKDTDSSYAQNLAAYGAQKNTAGDNAAFQASTHGLFGSGLAQNMQNKVNSDYDTNVSNLSELRANKLADIASRRQLASQNYGGASGTMRAKYLALGDEYNQQQADYNQQLASQNALYQAQMKAAFN